MSPDRLRLALVDLRVGTELNLRTRKEAGEPRKGRPPPPDNSSDNNEAIPRRMIPILPNLIRTTAQTLTTRPRRTLNPKVLGSIPGAGTNNASRHTRADCY